MQDLKPFCNERGDEFSIVLDKSADSSIVFLQLTDLHLGSSKEDGWKKDLMTSGRIEKLVEEYNPDALLITGDLLTGEKPFGALLCSATMQFFDKFKRPWIYVFGNHDPEGGFGREAIAEVFSKSTWGVLGKHIVTDNYTFKYDYVINVRHKDEKNPVWQIYGFDSGSEKGFKSIKKDQLKWYEEKAKEAVVKYGSKVSALAMFHIPLLEFESLRKNNTILICDITCGSCVYINHSGQRYFQAQGRASQGSGKCTLAPFYVIPVQ